MPHYRKKETFYCIPYKKGEEDGYACHEGYSKCDWGCNKCDSYIPYIKLDRACGSLPRRQLIRPDKEYMIQFIHDKDGTVTKKVVYVKEEFEKLFEPTVNYEQSKQMDGQIDVLNKEIRELKGKIEKLNISKEAHKENSKFYKRVIKEYSNLEDK